jgi:hypothetical protein
MRRHWKKLALLVAATALAASVLFAICGGEPEPTYQGRTLSDWLLDARSPTAEAEALVHMGTNALPHLVKWACNPPPKWRESIANLCLNHPKMAPKPLTDWLNKRTFLHNATIGAFSLLDTNAYPALPQLSLIVTNTKDEASALSAYSSISVILRGSFLIASRSARPDSRGKKVVLEQAFQLPNPIVRQAATNAHRFGELHNWP